MRQFIKQNTILILILIFALLSRLIIFSYPNTYVFDEVYHAFTAKEYVQGSRAAWDPWASPPKGVAYEWTHPPLAKEIMALSLFSLNTTDAWAWRLPGILLGVVCVFLVYQLSLQLFKKKSVGLFSAAIFSLEGLTFVQSRTGMNDIYLITFLLVCILFFLKERFIFSAIFLGLALATKWPALYVIPVLILLLIFNRHFSKIIYFILIPPIIYLISYLPYFNLGFNVDNFIQLQQQMWWYHTKLKATHDYTSPWWSWPFNLYPVWYFVDYQDNKMSNIFASGNPLVFWMGFTAILITAWEFIKTRSFNLGVILLFYTIFILPWALSPRIMFLYHYSPSIPFMTIILGYQLNTIYNSNHRLVIFLFILMFLGFVFIYPFLIGIPLPREAIKLFFLTNLTKNPF